MTRRLILYSLFFLSGLTSLVYQILWTRRLTLILGHSVLAVSTVVSITMAGLALGAWLAGRAKTGSPKRQVKRYAALEAFIGVWALLSFPLLEGTNLLYLAAASAGLTGLPLYLTGVGGGAFVLLPPTAAMGATLPLLSVALVEKDRLPGILLSELYGINTLGAFAGASLTGFALLPLLGASLSLSGAAVLNFALAGSAWLLGAEPKTEGELIEKPPEQHLSPLPRLPLLAFALVGVASMTFQIGWTRGLVLTLGSSTYSFAAVLSVFLLGIALGSYLFALLPQGWVRQLSTTHLGGLVFGGALTAGLSVLLLGYLPLIFIFLFSWTSGEFSRLLGLQIFLIVLVIGPTCLCMGLVFPALHQVYGHRDASLGHQVSQFYSSNTVGCILGAFLCGFLFIPQLGAQGALQLGVLLQLGACCCFLRWTGRGLCLLVAVACFSMPTWNPGLMAAGSGVYSQSQQSMSLAALKREIWRNPTFYKDGISTTVSIHMAEPGQMTVRVNGKVDASLIQTDRQTVYLAGYLGGFFVSEPTRAAVIGLGSGMTLEALSHFSSLQLIECAELEPAMLEANRYWSGFNGHVLEDPRVKVRLTDGRTMLQAASEPYDVIVSEPSNPWIAGVADLYTREFFSICRDRLTESGVMIQWFHFYGVSEQELAMVFNSFFAAFPHGSVWISAPGDLLLVGSKKPIEPSVGKFEEAYEASPILQRRFFELGLLSPNSVPGLRLFDRESALQFSPETPLNTDDRPLLEFTAPQHLFQQERVDSNLRLLTSHAGPPEGDEPAAVAHAWLNFGAYEWVRRWLMINSKTPEGMFVGARFLAKSNQGDIAQQAYKAALESSARPEVVAALWAEMEFRSGRLENAALLYDKSIKQKPDWSLIPTLQTRMAQALVGLKQFDQAVAHLESAIRSPLATHTAYTTLAAALTHKGETERAEQILNQSLKLNRYAVETHLGLAFLAMRNERWEDANHAYGEALALVPDSIEALVNKGLCLVQLDQKDEAVECFRAALRFQPNHPVAAHNLTKLTR